MLPPSHPGLPVLTMLIWLGCFLPVTIWSPDRIQTAIAQEVQKPGKWYVVTRAFMLKQGAEDIRKRLLETGYTPELIIRKEKTTLYAFDDKRTFRQRRQAKLAIVEWEKHGVKAAILPEASGFRVSLGRYLIPGYAKEFENRLTLTGIPFSLQMQETEIPTYRYSFQFSTREKAEQNWQTVNEIGATDPTLMDEKRMRLMFGKMYSAD
ncbi:MAG: hypothetical protein ACE5DY_02995 [Mariprofundaceae bacterium]